jgi:hypothetical protein
LFDVTYGLAALVVRQLSGATIFSDGVAQVSFHLIPLLICGWNPCHKLCAIFFEHRTTTQEAGFQKMEE